MTKTALLTGASKRIGAHIAKHLSRRGYNIVLHYNQSKAAALNLKAQILETLDAK